MDEQVKEIGRRLRAGTRMIDLAAEYGVNRKTIRRRLDALERLEAERARGRTAPPSSAEQPDLTGPLSGPASTARLDVVGGLPIFPDTPEGNAERLAYYEARKLNHLPDSLLDYHDVLHGRETPAERRARERGATGRRR